MLGHQGGSGRPIAQTLRDRVLLCLHSSDNGTLVLVARGDACDDRRWGWDLAVAQQHAHGRFSGCPWRGAGSQRGDQQLAVW
jgi:hypothetical protein